MADQRHGQLYGEYLSTLARRFDSLFGEILAKYNFDFGDEFEIAFCKALRAILPHRFGVSRGFAVTQDGTSAGDDIIIFDRHRFPTLRLLPEDDFAQKEQVPVEAVYAYIEAKHCLHLQGTEDDAQSLAKACRQVAQVKGLRPGNVNWDVLSPQLPFACLKVPITIPTGWPKTCNPLFGAVFAREVRLKRNGKLLNGLAVKDLLSNTEITVATPPPDLIVAGEGAVMLPASSNGSTIHSPFFIENESIMVPFAVPDLAFAVGVCSLLYALDTIRLGMMPWGALIADGLGIKTEATGTQSGE